MNLNLGQSRPRPTIKCANALTVLTLLAIASIFVWLGFIEWPGMHLDSAFFSPPVINVANGRGWHFGGYTQHIPQNGNDSYTFHGFLHILLYGEILKSRTWQSLGIWMGVVNAATYIAYFALYKLVLRHGKITNHIIPYVLAFVPGLLTLGLQGRPEQLLLIIFFVPAMLWALSVSGLRWLLPSAVAAGLAPLASPLPGTIFALCIILFYTYFEINQPRRLLSHLTLACVVIFLTAFLATKVFTPLDPFQWFNTTFIRGGTAFLGYKFLFGFTNYKWGFTHLAPLWNIALLFFITLGLLKLVRSKSYVLITICAGLILILTPKLLDYGYNVFLPLCLLICLDKRSFLTLRLPAWLTYNKMLIAVTAWAFLYLYVILSYTVLASGISFKPELASSARVKLDQQLHIAGFSKKGSIVAYDSITRPSLAPLSDGSLNYAFISKDNSNLHWYEKLTGKSFDFFIIPQTYPNLQKDVPKHVMVNKQKYELIFEDWAHSKTPIENLLWPKDISQDYRFALYKRVDF